MGQQQQEEVRQQADALFEPLIPLLEGLQNPLESQLDETVDRAIASLVVQIAREVIKSELSIKPEHVVGIVNNLFQQLPMTEREVRISLHPQDRALIESGEKLVDNGYQWKLESDEQMSRGGCRIDSPHFSADETVEQRLQQSVKQLFGDLDLELDQPTENGEQPEAVPEEGEEHGQESDAEMHAPEEAVAEVEEVSAASEEGSEPIAPEPSSAQQEP
ncbi:MAG: hypothetical protein HN344_00340 [Gammaproteobacteria bacterium]|nr:hypothetical protein [Gammaproteobacteria bacterium]